MVLKQLFNSKAAIIFAGIILAGYLILIIGVTNLGQSKLEQSQQNELHLKVNNYADALSFFFDVSKDEISNLAKDKTMATFFANLASGMSMQYGLSSSLFNVKRLIKQLVSEKRIDNTKVYNRVILVDFSKSILSDTHPEQSLALEKISLSIMEEMDQADEKILVIDSLVGPKILLLKTVYLQSKPVALIIAEINNNLIVQQLSAQEHKDSGSRLQLTTPIGDIFIWDSLKSSKPALVALKHQQANHLENKIYIEKPIENTPFKLISWSNRLNEQDLFTSGWFVLGISLFAIPLILGLYYLLRVYNNNVQLKTQVYISSMQQENLTQQNTRLHDEIMKRKASERQLEYQATHDALTGLPNRKFAHQQLKQAINRSQRNKNKVLVLFIDLDNFKQINDTLGHHAGDQILKQAATRLLHAVRSTDTVARLGGDEFLLIIPELSDDADAKMLANKILSLFALPFEIANQEFFTTTSIGMSIYPQDSDSPDGLLQNADTALYRVKEAGRNGFSFYDSSMNKDVVRSLALDNHLRQAISNNELEMYYQPIIDFKSRKIIAAEALMRWNDSELGFISPDEFIPLAEKNGLIHNLGEFALEQACFKAAEWQSVYPISIAVNFSAVQFRYCDDLLASVKSVLQKTGLPASKLDIEVTESLLINKNIELLQMLAELKALGIQLSMDDFGTGYSSLSYLQKFSFSKLKIDRVFVTNMNSCDGDRALVAAIIAMAKALSLKVVAEGVEDDWQASALELHGCEYGQGYLFSRPVCAAEFKQLLINDNLEKA